MNEQQATSSSADIEDTIYDALVSDEGFVQLTNHAPFRREMRRIAGVIAAALKAAKTREPGVIVDALVRWIKRRMDPARRRCTCPIPGRTVAGTCSDCGGLERRGLEP